VTRRAAEPAPGPVVTGLDPEYPIRTDRLMLRPWRMDGFDTYHRMRGDPEVARFLYDLPLTREEARVKLASLRSRLTEPGQWTNVAVEGRGRCRHRLSECRPSGGRHRLHVPPAVSG
jgi:RimJ/RimL family protein N-acetyltransferase